MSSSEQNAPNLALFPFELLSLIFSFVKFDSPVDLNGLGYFEKSTQNTADIKNLRLCCRAFARAADPLLLPVATCSVLDPESLGAFELLARHPLARHVRVVYVRLGYYHHKLADSPLVLAEYFRLMWSDYVEKTRRPFKSKASAIKSAVNETIESWVQAAGDPGALEESRGSDGRLRALLLIQAEYRRRFYVQQRLLESGDAARRLAEAMALMPAATRLVFGDHDRFGPWHLGRLMGKLLRSSADIAERPQDLLQMVTPSSWLDTWKMICGYNLDPGFDCTPPMKMITDLPIAIHRAGIKLTGLRVLGLQLPPVFPAWNAPVSIAWEKHPPMVLEDCVNLHSQENLAEACQELEVLELTPLYTNGYFDIKLHTQNNIYLGRRAYPFVSLQEVAITMFTPRLRQLHLDCSKLIYDDTRGFNSDGIFEASHWPGLEVLHLTNATLRNTNRFMDMVRSLDNLYELRLHSPKFYFIYLACPQHGYPPCVALIDALRDETPRLQANGERLKKDLAPPSPPIRMTNVKFEFQVHRRGDRGRQEAMDQLRHFLDNKDAGHEYSPLDEYIRGATDINPLVKYQKFIDCL